MAHPRALHRALRQCRRPGRVDRLPPAPGEQGETRPHRGEISDNGRVDTIRSSGEGAIEAFVNAWTASYGNRINVVDYTEHSLGEATNAEAVAYVQLNIDGQRSAGAAFDRDTVERVDAPRCSQH